MQRMPHIVTGALVLALCLAGCTRKTDAEQTQPTSTPTPVQPIKIPPADPTPPPALLAAVISAGQASMKDVADDKTGKWKATLMRGEKVQLLDDGRPQNGFLHVKLSDGSDGFVSERTLLVGEIEEVVALEEKPLFARPDEAAPRLGKVTVGTLLFVTRQQDLWAEVRLPKGNVGWMKATDFSHDAAELDAARSVFRYELLKDQKNKREQAEQILNEAIARHPDSTVLKAGGFLPGSTKVESPENADQPASPTAGHGPLPVETPGPTPVNE
ncbi:MAG: hypothetical protein JXR83_03680 [Deltaproteobacteria bacterium]|nr:hypothetical protein [Deltaproteobacteria bacterium]